MLPTEVDRDLLMSIEFKRFQFQPDVNADRRGYQRLVDLGWFRRLDALSYETTNLGEAQCAIAGRHVQIEARSVSNNDARSRSRIRILKRVNVIYYRKDRRLRCIRKVTGRSRFFTLRRSYLACFQSRIAGFCGGGRRGFDEKQPAMCNPA